MTKDSATLSKDWEVSKILREMDLEPNDFDEATRANYLAYTSCTKNDATCFPGIYAWGMTLRALSEKLISKGWERINRSNYPLIVNRKRRIGIVVHTGNEDTGLASAAPQTKFPKGPQTNSVVERNRQLSLFPEKEMKKVRSKDEVDNDIDETWFFLINRQKSVVKRELSLPIGMSDYNHVQTWRTRIILPDFNVDPGDLLKSFDEFAPEPEIRIERKG